MQKKAGLVAKTKCGTAGKKNMAKKPKRAKGDSKGKQPIARCTNLHVCMGYAWGMHGVCMDGAHATGVRLRFFEKQNMIITHHHHIT